MKYKISVGIKNKLLLFIFIISIQPLVFWNCSKEDKILNNDTNKIILPDGYENRYYEGMRYGLFIPPSYDMTKRYPLITSLHGSTDTVSWDLGWYHDPIQSIDPCFVLTPKSLQARNGWGNSWATAHSLDMQKTLVVIDSLIVEFNIDTNRLYIYGVSMGGYGVFSVLAREPGMFAGAFSICGGGIPETVENVMNTPLWIFHGSDDNVVPVSYSKDIYQAILNAGGRHVRYTEYPGVGHDAWTPAWEEPTLEWWLLAQRTGVVHDHSDAVENIRYEIVNSNQVKLSWDPSSDQTNPDNQIWYYKLFRDSELIAEIDNTDTFHIDSTVVSSSTYLYSLAAVNYFFELQRGGSLISVAIP